MRWALVWGIILPILTMWTVRLLRCSQRLRSLKARIMERFLEVLDEVRLLLQAVYLELLLHTRKLPGKTCGESIGRLWPTPTTAQGRRDRSRPWSNMEKYSRRQFPNCPINLYQEILLVSSHRLLTLRVRGRHTQPQR
jgi:hypothetical protein